MKLLDKKAYRRNSAIVALTTPIHPVTRGTAQKSRNYFQAREAYNSFYLGIPDMVEEYMLMIQKYHCREYHPFTNYYGQSRCVKM